MYCTLKERKRAQISMAKEPLYYIRLANPVKLFEK